MEEKRYTVYMHINKINNKKYIGITSRDVNIRWGKNGSGYKGSTYFYNAINKYGWDNFEHLIIEQDLTETGAKNMEVELIAKYKAFDNEYGYNLTLGGQGNVPNDKTKIKMSQSQKKVWSNIDYKKRMIKIRRKTGATEEFKEKISKISKNTWKNEEVRLKRVSSLKENGKNIEFKNKMSIITKGINNGFYGKHHSNETKELMKNRKLGKKQTEEHKQKVSDSLKIKVVKLDLQGNYLATYNGISHIENIKSTTHISSCCKGKRKSCGGFKWMYYEDYIKQQSTNIKQIS